MIPQNGFPVHLRREKEFDPCPYCGEGGWVALTGGFIIASGMLGTCCHNSDQSLTEMIKHEGWIFTPRIRKKIHEIAEKWRLRARKGYFDSTILIAHKQCLEQCADELEGLEDDPSQ